MTAFVLIAVFSLSCGGTSSGDTSTADDAAGADSTSTSTGSDSQAFGAVWWAGQVETSVAEPELIVELPEDWPEDVTIPPGFGLVQSSLDYTGNPVLTLVGEGSVNEVFTYLRETLGQAGWEEIETHLTMKDEHGFRMIHKKGGEYLRLFMRSDGVTSQLAMVFVPYRGDL